MCEATDRKTKWEESLRKIEERRDYFEGMKAELDKEDEEEMYNIRMMEMSVEEMKECCTTSDISILQLLEEKSELLRRMRCNQYNSLEDCYLELKRECQRLDMEQEDIFCEMRYFSED